MEQQLQNLQLALFAALIVIVGAVALYIKQNLELRTKNTELGLRKETVDIDDTAMRNKISAEAQAIIQRLFVESNERIKTLEDDTRHNRDLIDKSESERTRLQVENEHLEQRLNESLAQQKINVDKLKDMETHVGQLQTLRDENKRLTAEVNELRQKVEAADARSEQRHAEMSRITGENFELSVNLKKVSIELENVRRLLRECNEAVIAYELKYPDLRKLLDLPDSGTPIDSNVPVDNKGVQNDDQSTEG